MAAADETTYVNVTHPDMEVVVLELTDGETWKSRKFSTVLAVFPSWGEDTDGDINWTQSAGTITINAAGASDSVICLLVFGRH